MASSSIVPTGGSHGKNGWLPYEFKVMLIDEEGASLYFVNTMLDTCHYEVEAHDNPIEALCSLCSKVGMYDLVIADIHMVTMPGFSFVERAAKGMKLPVITTCSDEDSQVLHQALECGACFHLVKPITVTNMEFVWKKSWRNKVRPPVSPQRVMRFAAEKMVFAACKGDGGPKGKRVLQIEDSPSMKLPRDESSSSTRNKDDVREKDGDSDSEEHPKTRLMWDEELHNRFLVAVALLGKEAVPTSIIGIMNVQGLTTKQVASHLQKYRKRMQKENEKMGKGIQLQNKLPASSAPASGRKPDNLFLGNQKNKGLMMAHYQKPAARKAPFILPKPAASTSQSTNKGHVSTTGLRGTYNQSSSSGKSPLILSNPLSAKSTNIQNNTTGNACADATPFLHNWKSQVEHNARRRLWTYQPSLSFQKGPSIHPKPAAANTTSSSNACGGITHGENKTGSSEINNAPLTGNIADNPFSSIDSFWSIFDTTAGTSSAQDNNVVLDTTNDSIQEPPSDNAPIDWAALCEFLGIDKPESDQATNVNSNFEHQSDSLGDANFDEDAFLDEILNDTDNEEEN